MLTVSRPPTNVTSPLGAKTTFGPRSFMAAGSRSCQRSGGSTMWSSTEMIRGNSSMRQEPNPFLTTRQVRGGRSATMQTTVLGGSEVEVSRIGLGGFEIGPEAGEDPDLESAV